MPGGVSLAYCPHSTMTATALVAILGLISGVIGTVLGMLNFLRDRAAVEVSLQWDLTVTPDLGYDSTKKWGVITVVNVGRRPIFVSHVAIRLPKATWSDGVPSYLVVMGGMAGKTLAEGSPAERHIVTQDGLQEFASHWRDMVAQVNDSAGRVWKSKKLRREKVPSWAETTPPAGTSRGSHEERTRPLEAPAFRRG